MSFRAVVLLAALNGVVALSYEILWYRAFAFLSWSNVSTFGLLLAFYLLGLALGGLWARRITTAQVATGDARPLVVLSGLLLTASVTGYLLVPVVARVATVMHWLPSLLLVPVVTGFSGATLPLLAHFAIPPDAQAGRRLSLLYLGNIVGACLGSFVTGFILLDVFTLAQVSQGLLLVGLGQSALLLWLGGLPRAIARRHLALCGALGLAGLLAAPVLFDRLWERLQWKREFDRSPSFSRVVENRSGVITVTTDDVVYGGGIYDGVFNTGLAQDRNNIYRLYVLGALRPEAQDILEIGVATGSWTRVLVDLPATRKVTAVEINPGYLPLIAEHAEVSGLLTDPRVDLRIDDGRRFLKHTDALYDLIVVNHTWHFVGHSTNLLAVEFFREVKRHLRPGGVFFYNTTSSVDALATGLSLFQYGRRIGTTVAVSDAPLPLDGPGLMAFIEKLQVAGRSPLEGTTEAERRALIEMPDTTPTGAALAAEAASGQIVTEDNLRTELHGYPKRETAPSGFLEDVDYFLSWVAYHLFH